ncbi:hypothetical protein [Catelliglobosispora koreensis]|uniref:hypothetical protein n=1 Tax=Catelliglobosispora koreensis TaxID=129052 RepID=UPI00036C655E|nr:hypothetical protein [Catelliglobosispora koreensis]
MVKGDKDSLALAISGLNVTLAHHAAWTEERFGEVSERFDAVDRKWEAAGRQFETIDVALANIDTRTAKIDSRLRFLELGQTSHGKQLDDINRLQVTMLKRLDKLDTGHDELKAGQARLESGQQMILGEMQGLIAQVERVLSFAIKNELTTDQE